jgi:hypothetical protein
MFPALEDIPDSVCTALPGKVLIGDNIEKCKAVFRLFTPASC